MKVHTFYSNIVTVANVFPMTRLVNTALYLSNILCFLGNFWFYVTNPLHFGFLTRDVPFINTLPTPVAHVLNHLWHLAPVYLFRNRQTIAETVAPPSVFLAAFLFTCYLVLFPEPVISRNYEMTRVQMLGVWYSVSAALLLYSTRLFQK